MKRKKRMRKQDIIDMAKELEWGNTFYKVDLGSIKDALQEARYYLEYGMSKDDYIDQQQVDANAFMEKLCNQ